MLQKFVLFCLVASLDSLHSSESPHLSLDKCLQCASYTNRYRLDGFGAQFQNIIYDVIYAELQNQEFFYTPFQGMDHNYEGDPDFLEKKEWLINFISNFPLSSTILSAYNPLRLHVYRYIESHLKEFSRSKALKKIKAVFRANKHRENYFEPGHLHVAVHWLC